jgi:hypothetical protein
LIDLLAAEDVVFRGHEQVPPKSRAAKATLFVVVPFCFLAPRLQPRHPRAEPSALWLRSY